MRDPRNPFRLRASEDAESHETFVRLFSPEALERSSSRRMSGPGLRSYGVLREEGRHLCFASSRQRRFGRSMRCGREITSRICSSACARWTR